MTTPSPASSPAPSLFDTCLRQLLSGDQQQQAAVGAQLENLPSQLLVQMVQSLAGRLRASDTELTGTKQQLAEAAAKLPRRRYIVDPPAVMNRVRNEDPITKRVEAVVGKWRPRSADEFTLTVRDETDNYSKYDKALVYDRTAGACVIIPHSVYWTNRARYVRLPYVISSALLMYRLACLFPVAIKVNESPKVVWELELEHIATGEATGFSEWKGGAMARVSSLRAGEPFESDMLELLHVLCAHDCPHPYDGTVAGTVA